MQNMRFMRQQKKKSRKRRFEQIASNLSAKRFTKVIPKRAKKVNEKGNPYYNEMEPSLIQQYAEPSRCQAMGSQVIHEYDGKYDARDAEIRIPSLLYPRKNMVIDCKRMNKCLLEIQSDHREETKCPEANIYLDYQFRSGQDYGYEVIGNCITCGYESDKYPIYNYVDFDNDTLYNSFYLSLIEAANSIGIGFRQLKLLCTMIDIPLPCGDIYQKYDERLTMVVKHQTSHCSALARKNELRVLQTRNLKSSVDASWPNKRYQRQSRNGFLYNISKVTHQMLDVQTRSKGFNFDGPSANMEPDMMKASLFDTFNQGFIPSEIGIDFDTSTNNIRQQTMDELKLDEPINPSYDPGHWLKNSTPRLAQLVKEALPKHDFDIHRIAFIHTL